MDDIKGIRKLDDDTSMNTLYAMILFVIIVIMCLIVKMIV